MRDHKFTLIVATVGRPPNSIVGLIHSMRPIESWPGEVLIVDQNGDSRLHNIESHSRKGLLIRRITSRPGLSIARNVGLQACESEYVGFPDDDCWYHPDTLDEVRTMAQESSKYSFFTGRLIDEDGTNCLLPDWPDSITRIQRSTIQCTICSATLFCQRSLLTRIGGFDEQMGAGAGFGAYEEIDVVRRMLNHGHSGVYSPKIRVGHPNLRNLDESKRVWREYSYARGYGYYLRKHNDHIRAWFRAFPVPLIRAILPSRTNTDTSRLYRAIAKGRIEGYLQKSITQI